MHKKRLLTLVTALAALAALVAVAGVSVAASKPETILTALLPGVGPEGEDGTATSPQSGGYHLTTVRAPGREGAPPDRTYTLTTIDTRLLPGGSQGAGYRLVSFVPETLQDNVCTHLPIVLRQW